MRAALTGTMLLLPLRDEAGQTSRVLGAMGYDADTARSAVRVSLGPTTTEEEIERFVDAWGAAYRKHRARAA